MASLLPRWIDQSMNHKLFFSLIFKLLKKNSYFQDNLSTFLRSHKMDNLMIFQRKFRNKFSYADDPITSKLHFISAKLAPQASYHPHKNSNSYQSNQNDDTCLISLVNFWAVHSVNGLVEAAAASEHREARRAERSLSYRETTNGAPGDPARQRKSSRRWRRRGGGGGKSSLVENSTLPAALLVLPKWSQQPRVVGDDDQCTDNKKWSPPLLHISHFASSSKCSLSAFK